MPLACSRPDKDTPNHHAHFPFLELYLYSQLRLNGAVKSPERDAIVQGVSNLQNHLVNQPFRIDEARLADAKAACADVWIQNRPAPSVEALRFDRSRIIELTGQQIAVPWIH